MATANGWRLALVGDPRQLQGVGRAGLLAELCANGRVDELERLHRFAHRWEADASLLVLSGDPRAFDAYEAHGRIIPGTLDEHLARMADTWITNHERGRTAALVASTNDHVDTINQAVQQARLDAGHLDPDTATRIAGGEHAHIGDVVATRRNDRRLTTTAGEPGRNRDTWTVTAIGDDGSLTVSHQGRHGDVSLPADYAREHVRLGYVATEHGWESDNVTAGMCVASPSTTRRGLYVAVTRGSDENVICVITDSNDIAEARDILDRIVATDCADIPPSRNAGPSRRRHQQPHARRRCQAIGIVARSLTGSLSCTPTLAGISPQSSRLSMRTRLSERGGRPISPTRKTSSPSSTGPPPLTGRGSPWTPIAPSVPATSMQRRSVASRPVVASGGVRHGANSTSRGVTEDGLKK